MFQLAQYRFFSPPDCFGRDLANIMPLPVQEQFAICAQLAFPDSKIPYVVTHIWNENLRRELNALPPTGPINEQEVLAACTETAGEILGLRKRAKARSQEVTVQEEETTLVPIPANVMSINKDVKTFDKTKVHMENGELTRSFNNIVATVESVLSDHHAIVKFRPLKSQTEYRVLCHSDDVFHLDFPENKQNTHKFSAAWDLWKDTAKNKKMSLRGLMKPGSKMRLNAVPLLSSASPPTTNLASVHYCSSGVLVGKNSLPHTVPVECIQLPVAEFNYPFKHHFQKIVASLDKDGKFLASKFGGELKPTTDDQPKIAKAWKKGPKGSGMVLRPEYCLSFPKNQSPAVVTAVKKPEPEKKKAEAAAAKLPNPVKTKTREMSALIQNSYGRVIKIINENYGIAVGIDPKGGSFQMLFDSFDLFLGNTSCKEMGKKLSDLIKVGDHIKYNAILIKSDKPLERDIRYLATAVVFADRKSVV